MDISLGNQRCRFEPWKPCLGKVFSTDFAFDCETTAIDSVNDWRAPHYVLGVACDGDRGFFVSREHLGACFLAHQGVEVIMHNAPFDLSVIKAAAPNLPIYEWVDNNLVWDSRLLHRLLTLATDGHTAKGSGQSTLETCAQQYLGVSLPKDVTDSRGNPIRTSYGQWLGRPPCEIDEPYLNYLAQDVLATYQLGGVLFQQLANCLMQSHDVWGYVSKTWLTKQIEMWGFQSHHIQLRAAIALREITANGLTVDPERRDDLIAELRREEDRLKLHLRETGYMPGQRGCDAALQSILRRIERQEQAIQFARTESGKIQTSQESLSEFATVSPFIGNFLAYKQIQNLKSALEKMFKSCLHPSFDPLLVTGRTSSFGEINAQNVSREDRVRSCFSASAGHCFINADYSCVELVTLAQAMLTQFGQRSHMAEAINAGLDLHTLVAAQVTAKAMEDVTSTERSKAKPINFGKPGGMGTEGLRRYAKNSFEMDLSSQEVETLADSWMRLFPEMDCFLKQDQSWGLEVASLLGLSEKTMYERTGQTVGTNNNTNEKLDCSPNHFHGFMCGKVLRTQDPRYENGGEYPKWLKDYFWATVEANAHFFNAAVRDSIRERKPSPGLVKEVKRVASLKGCFTLTGRLRAKASYCARHNTIFQGLAADGAKLALWKLWRAGYRIVNFIHDEFLIEVPKTSDLTQQAQTIKRLMIEGMAEVVPDVAVRVSYCATDRWHKDAPACQDDEPVTLWRPTESIHCGSNESTPAPPTTCEA